MGKCNDEISRVVIVGFALLLLLFIPRPLAGIIVVFFHVTLSFSAASRNVPTVFGGATAFGGPFIFSGLMASSIQRSLKSKLYIMNRNAYVIRSSKHLLDNNLFIRLS